MCFIYLFYYKMIAVVNIVALLSVCASFQWVSREEWGARKPTSVDPMPNPVPYVIIHHSYQPPACNTTESCEVAMRTMQDMHQIDNKWNDVGYSFAVGGDFRAYIGRGWSAVGAHSPRYNDKSIGICVIGDWRYQLPPQQQLETVKAIIECGVSEGYIRSDYVLLGHRQVRETECPGDALYNEIKTWPHYSPEPENHNDKRFPKPWTSKTNQYGSDNDEHENTIAT